MPVYHNQVTGWYCDAFKCRELAQNDKLRAGRQQRQIERLQAVAWRDCEGDNLTHDETERLAADLMQRELDKGR